MILRIVVLLVAVAVVRGLPQREQRENLGEDIHCVLGSSSKECGKTTTDCTCVPYYLCDNDKVNTDGMGVIDLRAGQGGCEDAIDVCCPNPRDNSQPIKPKPTSRNGCGQRHPEGVGFRITGDSSNEAQFGEFPWMVALLRRIVFDNGIEHETYHCGGVLIHERVVLTVAHCVDGNAETGKLIARVGEWDRKITTEYLHHQDIEVSKVIIHPDFNRRHVHNDFALLLLAVPATLGQNVDTVCLPPQPDHVPRSTECYATGWGKDKFGAEGKEQEILKKIELPIVPNDQCVDLLRKDRLGESYNLHDSFVCAGGGGKDTCKGDGGSPLVCPIEGKPGTYEVTGLVSWGLGCGGKTPGVYAGVAYAKPWIEEEVKGLGLQLES